MIFSLFINEIRFIFNVKNSATLGVRRMVEFQTFFGIFNAFMLEFV